MRGQAGFWDIDERYERLSAAGDPLEKLNAVVPWEVFRKPLAKAVKRSDRAKGGRPPFDAVLMFKILVLQALYNLSDDQAEFVISDRLSFMRFLGLGLDDKVPDAKTIWLFREQLGQTRAIDNLFARFDKHLSKAGYLAKGGQIVDATIVAAPKQRNSDGEKADIKAGKIPEAWKDKPAKLRQKDRDARWTVKFSKAKVDEDGRAKQRDLAVPAFGYKDHASIDRRHGFIRGFTVTSASAYDGAQLRNVLSKGNTGSTVADASARTWKGHGTRRKARCLEFARLKGPMKTSSWTSWQSSGRAKAVEERPPDAAGKRDLCPCIRGVASRRACPAGPCERQDRGRGG